MKRLTNNEIQQIEKYLDKKGIDYVDIRFEILDHMILQIEEELNNGDITFYKAFLQVTRQWNQHFKETFSFMFGVMYTAPKLIIKKAKRRILKYYIINILSCIIFIPLFFNKDIQIEIPVFLKFMMFLLLTSSFMMFLKIIKSNKKTVYSFIVKTKLMVFILYPVIVFGLCQGLYFTLWFFFNICTLFYFSIVFLKQHQKIINQ